MIAIDTSAVVTVLLGEPAAESLVAKLDTSEAHVISLVSVLEAVMVLSRTTSQPQTVIDGYLLETKIEPYAFDATQAQWARHAFLTYGKGRHPARLNFGDCISYALAKSLAVPLLYVGEEFGKTDLVAA
ncbi:MAG TPA: type II toxin-antitoxin system VapC family toxin [Rhizomicrobium sp.]